MLKGLKIIAKIPKTFGKYGEFYHKSPPDIEAQNACAGRDARKSGTAWRCQTDTGTLPATSQNRRIILARLSEPRPEAVDHSDCDAINAKESNELKPFPVERFSLARAVPLENLRSREAMQQRNLKMPDVFKPSIHRPNPAGTQPATSKKLPKITTFYHNKALFMQKFLTISASS